MKKNIKNIRKHLSKSQKAQLILNYKNKCSRCNRTFYTNERVEFDHIKELRFGGRNTFSNFQPLCVPCHKLKTYKEKTLPYSSIDYNPSDYEYTNTYDITLIKNHTLPDLTPQKFLQVVLAQVTWITQIFNRMDNYRSEISDIDKLMSHIQKLSHDRKYRSNESFTKDLAKYSSLLPVFPVSGMKFWVQEALKILKEHKKRQISELDRLVQIIASDETMRSAVQKWLVTFFYGGTKLLELILDNLTYEAGYFTTQMILSHEIYKTLIHNTIEKAELSMYKPDKVHLSDWLNRQSTGHKFGLGEMRSKYERIGYDLQTGEVIYIRTGQYNQIKNTIPKILFEA